MHLKITSFESSGSLHPVLTNLRFSGAEDVELVDSIHAQNAPPHPAEMRDESAKSCPLSHSAEMRDESAKSKGKPPNPTAFAVQFVPGLTTLLSSGNTPGMAYGAQAKIQNPWRRRRRLLRTV